MIFFISRTKQNYTKPLTASIHAVSETALKIKVLLPWTFFKFLISSLIICQQKLLHEKEIVEYLKN